MWPACSAIILGPSSSGLLHPESAPDSIRMILGVAWPLVEARPLLLRPDKEVGGEAVDQPANPCGVWCPVGLEQSESGLRLSRPSCLAGRFHFGWSSACWPQLRPRIRGPNENCCIRRWTPRARPGRLIHPYSRRCPSLFNNASVLAGPMWIGRTFAWSSRLRHSSVRAQSTLISAHHALHSFA